MSLSVLFVNSSGQLYFQLLDIVFISYSSCYRVGSKSFSLILSSLFHPIMQVICEDNSVHTYKVFCITRFCQTTPPV